MMAGKVGELQWRWRIRFARDGRWAARGVVPGLFRGVTHEFLSGTARDDEFSEMLKAEREWAARAARRDDAREQFGRIGAELGVLER